jgi:hypothetical protein
MWVQRPDIWLLDDKPKVGWYPAKLHNEGYRLSVEKSGYKKDGTLGEYKTFYIFLCDGSIVKFLFQFCSLL